MDIQTLLASAKPVLLKLLVGIITFGLIKIMPHIGVPLDSSEIHSIAALGGATIIGIGMNWAAKTHATISSAASQGPDPGSVQKGSPS